MGRSLNQWNVVAAKAEGTSHTLNNESCQDHFETGVFLLDGQEIFYSIVSDGAGSALMGKAGSEAACQLSIEFLRNMRAGEILAINENVIYELVEYVIDGISQLAIKQNLILKDYACTLLGVVITENTATYFQIGDGAIIINEKITSSYMVVYWPDSGEYANMTNFITDPNATSNLKIKCLDYIPTEISLFTDGLQRLCLHFETRSVHEPFFKPMFKALSICNTDDDLNDLHHKLNAFLRSSKVNERTDDDKTLVLASRNSNE